MTGFAKTWHNGARTEIHFIESHTIALSRQTSDRAEDDQVCFHRQHLSDHDSPLRGVWCHWGALIRLHVVLIASCFQRPSCPDMYTVAVFVLYSTHSGSFSQPVDGLTRLRLPTCPSPTSIELIHDIGGVQKKVSQNPAVY